MFIFEWPLWGTKSCWGLILGVAATAGIAQLFQLGRQKAEIVHLLRSHLGCLDLWVLWKFGMGPSKPNKHPEVYHDYVATSLFFGTQSLKFMMFRMKTALLMVHDQSGRSWKHITSGFNSDTNHTWDRFEGKFSIHPDLFCEKHNVFWRNGVNFANRQFLSLALQTSSLPSKRGCSCTCQTETKSGMRPAFFSAMKLANRDCPVDPSGSTMKFPKRVQSKTQKLCLLWRPGGFESHGRPLPQSRRNTRQTANINIWRIKPSIHFSSFQPISIHAFLHVSTTVPFGQSATRSTRCSGPTTAWSWISFPQVVCRKTGFIPQIVSLMMMMMMMRMSNYGDFGVPYFQTNPSDFFMISTQPSHSQSADQSAHRWGPGCTYQPREAGR